jgi:hypothetical protein
VKKGSQGKSCFIDLAIRYYFQDYFAELAIAEDAAYIMYAHKYVKLQFVRRLPHDNS